MAVTTLESAYTGAKAVYESRYGADSWQWRDEGSAYAIMDYLSSYELTDADRAFIEREGLKELVAFIQED